MLVLLAVGSNVEVMESIKIAMIMLFKFELNLNGSEREVDVSQRQA